MLNHLLHLKLFVYLRLIIGILSLCTSAHLTVLSLFNPVLNLTFSLLPITSSHPHASASDSTFNFWHYINILLTLTLTPSWINLGPLCGPWSLATGLLTYPTADSNLTYTRHKPAAPWVWRCAADPAADQVLCQADVHRWLSQCHWLRRRSLPWCMRRCEQWSDCGEAAAHVMTMMMMSLLQFLVHQLALRHGRNKRWETFYKKAKMR